MAKKKPIEVPKLQVSKKLMQMPLEFRAKVVAQMMEFADDHYGYGRNEMNRHLVTLTSKLLNPHIIDKGWAPPARDRYEYDFQWRPSMTAYLGMGRSVADLLRDIYRMHNGKSDEKDRYPDLHLVYESLDLELKASLPPLNPNYDD